MSNTVTMTLKVNYKDLEKQPNKIPYELITTIDLTNNNLKTLPDLSKCINLDTLDCSHNNLEYLPENLPDSITELNLNNNNLIYFPDKLPDKLHVIWINNNPILELNYKKLYKDDGFYYGHFCSNSYGQPIDPTTHINIKKRNHEMAIERQKERMAIINKDGALIQKAAEFYMHPNKLQAFINNNMELEQDKSLEDSLEQFYNSI